MNALPLVLVAVPPVLVAGWTLLTHAWHAHWHRRARMAAPRLGPVGFVAYHLREMVAIARIAWWHVRAFFSDGLRRPTLVEGRPVLFVHGFTQDGTNGWGIRRRLEALGRPTAAVSLGRPLRSVRAYADPLVQRLRELAGPEGIDVVAHSLGGVVLRQVLAEHPDLARHVRRVVTLGSPHHGTAGTRAMRRDVAVDISELSRDSAYIAALPDFAAVAPHVEVTTVAATTDLIVYPASTCHLDGARHVDLDGVGHAGLLTSARALDVVAAVLQKHDGPDDRVGSPGPVWVVDQRSQTVEKSAQQSP